MGVDVSTKRIDTPSASASLTYYGKNTASKVYYVVTDNDGSGAASTSPSDITKLTKTANFSSNKVTDEVVSTELETGESYVLYYIVEDNYGNRTGMAHTVISKEKGIATQEAAPTEMTEPNFNPSKNFSWKLSDGQESSTVKITLYKNNKIIKEIVRSTSNTAVSLANNLDGAGKYKVEVTVLGKTDGSTMDSEVVSSKEVTVTALSAVTDIVFTTTEEGTYELSWKDSKNNKDYVEEYEVELVTINADGSEGAVSHSETAEVKADEPCTAELSSIQPNTVYAAKVTVKAKANIGLIIDSEEAVSDPFFVVETGNITSETIEENSVTFKVADLDALKINGNVPTWEVEVYTLTKDTITDQWKVSETPVKKSVTVTKNEDDEDIIVVNGLNPDTRYAFKFIATVGTAKGESKLVGYTSGTPDGADKIVTCKKAAKLENLKVVEKNAKNEYAEGTFCYTATNVAYINGEKYDVTTEGTYSEEFTNLIKQFENIKLYPDDVIVSATSKKLSFKLSNNASDETASKIIAFTVDKDVEVSIEGNTHQRGVKATGGIVTLTGTNALFTIESGSAATKTILDNGVSVKTSDAQELTVKSNATIDGTKVTATAEATIKTDTNKLQVVVDGNSTTGYTFENKENSTVTIEFVSLNKNGSDQQIGNVTILSNGGTITVTTPADDTKVGVTAPIEVEVQKGSATVDMKDNYLSGNKTVTVKEDTTLTVKVTAKENAPQALTALSVDSTIEEIKTAVSAVASDEAGAKAVKDYLDSFGLSGTGAKVTVAKSSADVTILFEKAVTDVTIKNIK